MAESLCGPAVAIRVTEGITANRTIALDTFEAFYGLLTLLMASHGISIAIYTIDVNVKRM